MKVTEHLAKADQPLISFEIIPPLRGGNVQGLLSLIDDLVKYAPPFIDITSHAAESIYEETPEGTIQRRVKRKRPGTLGVCALLQNKYQIDAVPHILCQGFTREETEDFLIELRYLGIDNVLAVRGDDSGFAKPLHYGRSANRYASELVAQISSMNKGRYLEAGLLDAEPTHFCIGVGGYPEKHFEAPNLEIDVRRVKEKVEAGADYVVTQMFFDNRHYFHFVDLCRAAGIEVPIIPGLKILTAERQLSSIPRTFYVDIPPELADAVLADPQHVVDIGVEWALKQSDELLAHGVPSLHFYVMQNATAIKKLMAKLKR
jgi:methylenetetrahydrofolate reductase (NADPH)